MFKRIRYREKKTGVFESIQIFESLKTKGTYRVIIDENLMIYKIINISKRNILRKGKAKNKRVLRNKAKSDLLSLGVIMKSFWEE